MEDAILKAVANAGAGAAVAVVVLVGIYRLTNRLGLKFIEAQERQAQALGAQAQAMEGLTKSIEGAVAKDGTDHREMLVLLRFIAQRQQEFEEVRVEHNDRKEQAHPHCPARAA
jgi:hypothetical protein